MNKEKIDGLLEVACCRYHKDLCEELHEYIINLQQRIDKAVELKHNWQSIKENAMIVFENNSLIEFMNNLENILKGDDTNDNN